MEYGLVVLWLAAYAWLAVAGLPVAAALLRRLPGRGAGLALPLSLAVVWVVAYWVGHLARLFDPLTFGYPALVAGLVVLLALDAVVLRRGVDIDWGSYRRAMVVFGVAFLFMVALRSLNPAAWAGGGEKFLDFGLLASSLRTAALPPEDFWFAGEPELYYYGGHLLASLLARLTATPATHAYNLANAGYYAIYVSAAYGLAGAMAATRGRSAHAAGVAAAVLVGIASNLATPVRLLVWLLPGGAGEWLAGIAGVELKGLALDPSQFNYWHAHLVIPGTNNEFPFFAWLNGDMHAHMMAMPFLLLVAGILFAYYRTPAAAVWRRRLLVGSVVPLVGFTAASFTWGVPTIGGLVWLTLVFGPGHPADLLPGKTRSSRYSGGEYEGSPGAEITRTVVALAVGVGVTLAGALAAAPYLLRTTGAKGVQGIGVLPTRSGLGPLVVVHGAFLLVSALYLRGRLSLDTDRRGRARLAGAWLLLLGVTALYDATVIALFVPLLVAGWWLLRTTDRLGFEGVLLVAVSGLVVLTEFVYVEELAGHGRYNTVFKTYVQVWALWATAAGAMLPGMARVGEAYGALRADLRDLAARVWYRDTGTGAATATNGGGWRLGRHRTTVLVVVLLLSVSLYGAFSVAWAVDTGRGDPTLDARDYLGEHHPREVRAIEYLDDRPGQPTIATAPGVEIYRWANGPSSLTGVPTLAGWIHEVGYRGPEAYFGRVRAVNRLFNGTADRRAELVDRYDVDYVYVGPVERDRYGYLDFRDESWVAETKRFGAVDLYVVAGDRDG